MNKEVETVFDSEKEIKIKRAFPKEKKNARALLFEATCPSASLSTSVPESSALFAFAFPVPEFSALLSVSVSAMPILRLSAPLFQSTMSIPVLSDPPSLSTIPIPGLSALPSLSAMPVPGSFAPPFLSAILMPESSAPSSLSAMLVPRLSAPPSPSAIPLPGSSTLLSLSTVLTLYFLLFLIWFFL